VAALPEDTDTAAALKVAEINVVDDGLGANVLSLAGADAGMFEIVGNTLYLRAGAVLDPATNPQLDVQVRVDDTAIPGSPDGSVWAG
jgi:hypothetical protein